MKQVHYHSARKLRFTRDERGAVTVDWIVLTAAVVFMGMAAAFIVASNVPQVANNVAVEMDDMEPGTF